MKMYTHTGAKRVIDKCKDQDIGLLMVDQWRDPSKWNYYAIDNGAFSYFNRGIPWNPSPFLSLLYKAQECAIKPDFVVCPDIVAGGDDSLEFSKKWMAVLPKKFDYYLAVQDGMNTLKVLNVLHSYKFSGIFVGGTTDWKLETAEKWCQIAHKYNIGCHIGRIGPMNRIKWADRIGADSIDSTTWVQRESSFDHIMSAKAQTILEELQ